jgi:phosphopantothenoylcysteine decarboxylase/phosphopantothenate--cysteine ligase
MPASKTILLIISGGIAAYKALDLIRLLKKDGHAVRCVLTRGGAQFVTPLSVTTLAGEKVYDDLWSLTDEAQIGHIALARQCDAVVVAPASADIMAKMAHGLADDLATTLLLACDKPVLLAPAMNHVMWSAAATQANVKTLTARGARLVGPVEGDMACGEHGVGRMAEPDDIKGAIDGLLR